jgi:hypothetical protein
MNWERLLTSPPPATAWDLGAAGAVVIHRTAPGELHCATEDVPPGAFEVGPVGLQAVDEQALTPVFTRLKGAAEGASTAAVIVPTRWMRSFLLEAERLPRKESELHDVVRWRLKKLLPVAPTELRLSVVRLPEIWGRRRILILAGIERAVASLEATFRAIGIEPGLITTRLFALVPRSGNDNRPLLVIQLENGFLSLMLLEDGVPRLLRTKPLSATAETADSITRELRLNLEYIRDTIGIDGDISVKLVCDEGRLDSELRQWMAGEAQLTSFVGTTLPPCGPSTVVDRVGAARLSPAGAVVSGEVR